MAALLKGQNSATDKSQHEIVRSWDTGIEHGLHGRADFLGLRVHISRGIMTIMSVYGRPFPVSRQLDEVGLQAGLVLHVKEGPEPLLARVQAGYADKLGPLAACDGGSAALNH